MTNSFVHILSSQKGVSLVQTLIFGALVSTMALVYGRAQIQQQNYEQLLDAKKLRQSFEDLIIYELSNKQKCRCFFKDFIQQDSINENTIIEISKKDFAEKRECVNQDAVIDVEDLKNEKETRYGLMDIYLNKSMLEKIELAEFVVSETTSKQGKISFLYSYNTTGRLSRTQYTYKIVYDPTSDGLSSCHLDLDAELEEEEVELTLTNINYSTGIDYFAEERMCDVDNHLVGAQGIEGQTPLVERPPEIPSDLNIGEGSIFKDENGNYQVYSSPEETMIPTDSTNKNLPIVIHSSSALSGPIAEYYVSAETYFSNQQSYRLLRQFSGSPIDSEFAKVEAFADQEIFDGSQFLSNPPLLKKDSGFYIAAIKLRPKVDDENMVEFVTHLTETVLDERSISSDYVPEIKGIRYNDFQGVKISEGSLFSSPNLESKVTVSCRQTADGGLWEARPISHKMEMCYNGKWHSGFATRTGRNESKRGDCPN